MTPDIEALCARLEGFAKNYSQSTHRCNRVDCQNPACIAYDCIKAAAALREQAGEIERCNELIQGTAKQCGLLKTEAAALQARVDALMLEYCPDDMTPEQRANWESHQRPATSEERAAIDAAMAAGEKS